MANARLCPKCREPLGVVHRFRTQGDPVEVEECRRCKGLWFDDRELRLATDAADHDVAWMDFEIWKHPERFRALDRPMTCPNCGGALGGVEFGQTGVTVDCCAPCRGVWLDGGQFERIVAALERELESKDAAGLVRDSLREAARLVTGGRSLAAEWRDLRTVLRLLHLRFFVEHPKLREIVRGLPPLG
jgi:Zn-finger nucleic acid-binding protein